MDVFEQKLNDLLISTYRDLEIIEGQMLQEKSKMDLSINEIHVLEAIGPTRKGELGRTISDVADRLGITLPSTTLAINRLVKKGYVEKRPGEGDRRMVYVQLTRTGKKAEHAHRYFHRSMVHAVANGMTDEEKQVLLKGVYKLHEFFYQKINEKEDVE